MSTYTTLTEAINAAIEGKVLTAEIANAIKTLSPSSDLLSPSEGQLLDLLSKAIKEGRVANAVYK